MRLTAGGRTDSGPRPLNQDWLHWDLELGLFIVADGMGGHNAGEVASHLAVESVISFIEQSRDPRDLTWPFGLDPSRSMEVNRLATAVRLANRRVHRESMAHAAFSGMGTTLVAILVADDRAVLASVGDSRIYRWRDEGIEQLTRDDTWLSALLAAGSEYDSPVASHPMRHVLTSVVGVNDELVPTLREETLQSGDRFLLCTDGVHGHADEPTLSEMLGLATSADKAALAIVDTALARGTTDNVTALVLLAK
jgi:serine/threonine protein phosphatase PrpC